MRICSMCTTDPERAVMIEEPVWDDHVRSKRHRKASRPVRDFKGQAGAYVRNPRIEHEPKD